MKNSGIHLSSRLLAALAALTLFATTGCDRKEDDSSESGAAPEAQEEAAPEGDESGSEEPGEAGEETEVQAAVYRRSTTDGKTAKRNLDAQIEGVESSIDDESPELGRAERLHALLGTRVQFFATYDDFDRMFAIIDALESTDASADKVAMLRAKAEAKTHQFSQARERIKELDSAEAKSQLRTIALAMGESLDDEIEEARARASEQQTFDAYVSLASLLGAAGEFDAADQAWRDAMRVYDNISPFPIAWAQFQRGVMWAERAGKAAKALPLYEDAVRLVPDYVVANVHLAELEAEEGRLRDAIARLDLIHEDTQDPEPSALLSELLVEDGDEQQAQRLAERADRMYSDLLEKYPAAFADHATEFYLGPGDDKEKAWSLASGNLENRQNARAYLLAAEAALASDRAEKACEILGEASRSPVLEGSVPLQRLVEAHREDCDGYEDDAEGEQ
jgi:Tfp pilus assembly protein PilF